jgi:galactose mutarotase-like enzyme
MKRYILWRPFIVDLKDTRLAYGEPRTFEFSFKQDRENPPSTLEVMVRYHLLDERRRRRIGYENKEPIAYPIYIKKITLQ